MCQPRWFTVCVRIAFRREGVPHYQSAAPVGGRAVVLYQAGAPTRADCNGKTTDSHVLRGCHGINRLMALGRGNMDPAAVESETKPRQSSGPVWNSMCGKALTDSMVSPGGY